MAEGNQEVKGLQYYIRKIRQGDSAIWEKEEVLDAVYWWRQVLGLLLGLVWAAVPLTGLVGVLGFFVANLLLNAMFYKHVLGVDDEDFGGAGEFFGEGMPGSIGIFLLTWTLGYTALHDSS